MARHAVLDMSDKVVNVIEIEPDSSYTPGSGRRVLFDVRCINANPGDTWSGAAFVAPNPPASVPDSEDVATLKSFMTSSQVQAYQDAAPGTATLAQTQAAVQSNIRTLKALIRVVRAITT